MLFSYRFRVQVVELKVWWWTWMAHPSLPWHWHLFADLPLLMTLFSSYTQVLHQKPGLDVGLSMLHLYPVNKCHKINNIINALLMTGEIMCQIHLFVPVQGPLVQWTPPPIWTPILQRTSRFSYFCLNMFFKGLLCLREYSSVVVFYSPDGPWRRGAGIKVGIQRRRDHNYLYTFFTICSLIR